MSQVLGRPTLFAPTLTRRAVRCRPVTGLEGRVFGCGSRALPGVDTPGYTISPRDGARLDGPGVVGSGIGRALKLDRLRGKHFCRGSDSLTSREPLLPGPGCLTARIRLATLKLLQMSRLAPLQTVATPRSHPETAGWSVLSVPQI
jgi:hypothetical protein